MFLGLYIYIPRNFVLVCSYSAIISAWSVAMRYSIIERISQNEDDITIFLSVLVDIALSSGGPYSSDIAEHTGSMHQ